MPTLKPFVWIVTGAAVLTVLYVGVAPMFAPWQQQSKLQRTVRDTAVPVTVDKAQIADVPVYLNGVGNVKALNTVVVRPQADGKLIEFTFKEGDEVKAGDVLARLDASTMQAQLDQVLAKKELDQSMQANSQRDLDRLVKAGTLAATQQQIDTQRALVAQQQAQIRSDDAGIANARTLLGYAAITAPIGGVTGLRQVDAGNVVRSQTDGIVVIAQVQPISVLFTVPERALSSVMTGAKSGPLIAEAYTTDGNQVLDAGELKVVDNQVDPTTGTVRLKADFPNSNRQLWPGQFVNVRLRVDTLKNVVVVPTPSVQQGPSGAFVYLAKGDGTVAVTLVTVGQQTEQRTVVTAGLAPGDSVVGSGFARLKDGAKIEQLARGSNKPMAPDGSRPDVPATGGNPPEAQVGSKRSGSEPASAGPEAAVAGPLPVKPADGSGLAGWTKGSGKRRHRNAADGNAIAGGAPGDGTGTAKDAAQ